MKQFIGILNMILPVLAMLGIGVMARKTQIISQHGIDQIKTFIVNFTLPATLFGAFWSMKFTWREGLLLITMSAVTLIAFIAGIFLTKALGIKKNIAPYLCSTIEGGSIGYALAILMSGQENLYHFALLDVGNAIIQWGVIMTILQMSMSKKKSGKEIAKSLITPINGAIVLGLLFSATGLGPMLSKTAFGGVISETLSFVSSPTGAVIIMTVGYGLVFENINWSEMLKGVLSRAVIFGVLGVAAFFITPLIFPGDALYRNAILLFFIMPPTYAYSVFVEKKDEEAYLSSFLAIYTLLTIVGFIFVGLVSMS